MRNRDPFAPWNDVMYRHDPFTPHNDVMRKEDPFEPWNDVTGNEKDLNQKDRDYYRRGR